MLQRRRLSEPVGNVAGKRPCPGRLNVDIDESPDEPLWRVEDHDPVAHRPSRQLRDSIRG